MAHTQAQLRGSIEDCCGRISSLERAHEANRPALAQLDSLQEGAASVERRMRIIETAQIQLQETCDSLRSEAKRHFVEGRRRLDAMDTKLAQASSAAATSTSSKDEEKARATKLLELLKPQLSSIVAHTVIHVLGEMQAPRTATGQQDSNMVSPSASSIFSSCRTASDAADSPTKEPAPQLDLQQRLALERLIHHSDRLVKDGGMRYQPILSAPVFGATSTFQRRGSGAQAPSPSPTFRPPHSARASSPTPSATASQASRAASCQATTSSKPPWANSLWYNPSVQPEQAPTQAPAQTPPPPQTQSQSQSQSQLQTVRTLQVSASNVAVTTPAGAKNGAMAALKKEANEAQSANVVSAIQDLVSQVHLGDGTRPRSSSRSSSGQASAATGSASDHSNDTANTTPAEVSSSVTPSTVFRPAATDPALTTSRASANAASVASSRPTPSSASNRPTPSSDTATGSRGAAGVDGVATTAQAPAKHILPAPKSNAPPSSAASRIPGIPADSTRPNSKKSSAVASKENSANPTQTTSSNVVDLVSPETAPTASQTQTSSNTQSPSSQVSPIQRPDTTPAAATKSPPTRCELRQETSATTSPTVTRASSAEKSAEHVAGPRSEPPRATEGASTHGQETTGGREDNDSGDGGDARSHSPRMHTSTSREVARRAMDHLFDPDFLPERAPWYRRCLYASRHFSDVPVLAYLDLSKSPLIVNVNQTTNVTRISRTLADILREHARRGLGTNEPPVFSEEGDLCSMVLQIPGRDVHTGDVDFVIRMFHFLIVPDARLVKDIVIGKDQLGRNCLTHKPRGQLLFTSRSGSEIMVTQTKKAYPPAARRCNTTTHYERAAAEGHREHPREQQSTMTAYTDAREPSPRRWPDPAQQQQQQQHMHRYSPPETADSNQGTHGASRKHARDEEGEDGGEAAPFRPAPPVRQRTAPTAAAYEHGSGSPPDASRGGVSLRERLAPAPIPSLLERIS
ncbi:hypothetical protein FA10DRAFT_286663 [Acaromyces ingoldii]|uniref:Uncharacterized protein n=1 Tax=Acaromyces ingoldii TaxID=215250 RepID=A0A316YQA1_9BASI|nr:hypothetical protein FA10DRAFT_286663 [Acaromyces ingoldii]PWN90994.1 hypothetical protein FA10DRAFT_286663 [Acaromyces ingoldii]